MLIFFFFFLIEKRRAIVYFFFFQAEDGIRDGTVTGVQTCALPISGEIPAGRRRPQQRVHPQTIRPRSRSWNARRSATRRAARTTLRACIRHGSSAFDKE